jgi:hypothetical protein
MTSQNLLSDSAILASEQYSITKLNTLFTIAACHSASIILLRKKHLNIYTASP